MKEYQPWDDSWRDEIVQIMLPNQQNMPVEMPPLFSYPVFLGAVGKGITGDAFWKTVAGAMIYVIGHQPDYHEVPSYVFWINQYNPSIASQLIDDGADHAIEGKTDRAIWLLQAAVCLQPEIPESHYNLGIVFSRIGTELMRNNKLEEGRSCLEQAAKYFQNALEIDPDLKLASYYLQDTCRQMV
jgi:tetratricopeptide (TPR) repeat protein